MGGICKNTGKKGVTSLMDGPLVHDLLKSEPKTIIFYKNYILLAVQLHSVFQKCGHANIPMYHNKRNIVLLYVLKDDVKRSKKSRQGMIFNRSACELHRLR